MIVHRRDGAEKATTGLVLAVERSARQAAPPGPELPAMAQSGNREAAPRRLSRRAGRETEALAGSAALRMASGRAGFPAERSCKRPRREARRRGASFGANASSSGRRAAPPARLRRSLTRRDRARQADSPGTVWRTTRFRRMRRTAEESERGAFPQRAGLSIAMNMAACMQGSRANERAEQGRKS